MKGWIYYQLIDIIFLGLQQVYTTSEDDYKKIKSKLTKEAGDNLILSKHNAPKVVLMK